MPIHELKEQIARLPEQPGVYLYFNADGDTIYVGKARALRDRVRNYLGAYGGDPKTDALLDEVVRLDVIVTDSVVEALALENNLIKQRTPKYNILLRDDKNYPYLQLTTNEAFPRVLVARRVERDGSFYAGPFLPAHFARKTMSLTHRLFGIRSCNEVITGKRGRPCLEYDIKRCIAPCVDTLCSQEEYGRAVDLTQLFLEGRNDELVKTLRTRMLAAAAGERFEEAAQLRDAMRTVQTLHDRQQKMATAELGHRDVFGLKLGPAGAVIQVFQVRSGRVVERIELGTEEAIAGSFSSGGQGDGEVLAAAIQQFYEVRGAPPEVHVPAEPDEREALEAWLSERVGRRVRISVPQRGEKRGFVDLANRNAALAYQTRFNQTKAAQYDALETLQHVLALPALPRRIECFDISTIQGSETVASMVVCEDGRMRRAEYRKYQIRGIRASGLGARRPRPVLPNAEFRVPNPESRVQDDFAAMHEVVLRRYRKLLEQGGPFPDLVADRRRQGPAVRGLCRARRARAGESRRGRHREEGRAALHARSRGCRLRWRPPIRRCCSSSASATKRIGSPSRFTAARERSATCDRSSTTCPASAPRRRKTLLTTFGSLAGVRRATREELAAVVGPENRRCRPCVFRESAVT